MQARILLRTLFALPGHLAELFAVAEDEVHVLIEGHELADKHAAVLDGDAHAIVDQRLRAPQQQQVSEQCGSHR